MHGGPTVGRRIAARGVVAAVTGWRRIRRWRPRKGALRIAGTLAIVGLVAWSVDIGQAMGLLAAANHDLLLLAFGALTVQTVVSAARWKITAARLDHRFSLIVAVREYYLAQFLNQTLPGGMVGDAGRAYRARHGAGLVRAGQAVLFERLSGQIALIGVAAPGFALTVLVPGGPDWPTTLGTIALVIGAGLVMVPILIFGGSKAPGAVGRASRDFIGAARHAIFAQDVLARQVGLSLGTVACNLVAFAACAAATGTPLEPLAVVTIVPIVLLAMLVPLSVAGWGVREGAAAMLFPVLGASPEAGVAASVAFGLVFLAVTLPGALVLIWEARRGRVRAGAAAAD